MPRASPVGQHSNASCCAPVATCWLVRRRRRVSRRCARCSRVGREMSDSTATTFHGRYLALVAELERRFPVARWKCGDVDVWPQARAAMYLDMYWRHVRVAPARTSALPLRVAGALAMRSRNYCRARGHRAQLLTRAHRAEALFLGD